MPLKHNSLASLFTDIAGKLRLLKGTSSQIVADDFPDEMAGLPLPTEVVEFIERTAPHNGPAVLEKILGKSIIWRQLANIGSSRTQTVNGITWEVNDDAGTLTAKAGGTASANSSIRLYDGSLIQGHKYYLAGCPSGGSDSTYRLRFASGNISELGSGLVFTAGVSVATLNAQVLSGYVVTADRVFRPRLIDLTDRFGAGYEPTTVEEALRLLGNYDPAYNAGEVQNNATTAIRARREPIINIWNEEWENGALNTTTGANTNHSKAFRTANYIKVTPSATYYAKSTSSATSHAMWLMCYDANHDAIATPGIGGIETYDNATRVDDHTFTVPANCEYIRFYVVFTTYEAYNHDICINLSDPAINGTYYSHWRGEVELNLTSLTSGGTAIFPNGLAKVGTAQDAILYGVVANKQVDKRAYQSGDESDPDVITDGTSTYYALTTPQNLALDTPISPNSYDVQAGDKEEIVSNNNCPFVGEVEYKL